jgi:hypothetical protein
MAKIVERLRSAEDVIAAKVLARVSPLAFHHVILNGTYRFNRANDIDGFAHNTLE